MSHRSYQPTRSCGSKLLQQKWDQSYYDEHRRMVKSAKPLVDTRQPQKQPHITAKWKKQQVERERQEEVEHDNHMLLCKMQTIMKTHGYVDHRNTYIRHHSLNEKQRQREMERVSAENKTILQRIQKVKPMHRNSDWIDDWGRSEELSQRITSFPPPRRATTLPARIATAPSHKRVSRRTTSKLGPTNNKTAPTPMLSENLGEMEGERGSQTDKSTTTTLSDSSRQMEGGRKSQRERRPTSSGT